MKIFKLIAAAALATTTLTACGGGGGSTAPAPTPQAATVVTGIASKGPFVQGSTVKVYAVVGGVQGTTPIITTTTTDDNGSYSANLGSYTGPIVVEVSGSYHDEATGATVPVAANAPIRAAIPAAQGTVTLPVTPLTELAVQKAGGSLTADAIAQANALVSSIFKVDIIATMPVVPTVAGLANATEAQKDYTLALAAVSQMASAATGANATEKLESALSALSHGITTGGLSTDASTAFQTALTDFVVNNPKNDTGIKDTTGTSLVNAGTLSKSYTFSLSGNAAAVDGIQFDVTLPEGVSVNVNSHDTSVLGSSLAMLAGAPSDALLAAGFSNRKVTVGVVSVKGIAAGDFAVITLNLPAGGSAPPASALSVGNLRVVDASEQVVTGVSVTVK